MCPDPDTAAYTAIIRIRTAAETPVDKNTGFWENRQEV
jgi:hypothetical protein